MSIRKLLLITALLAGSSAAANPPPETRAEDAVNAVSGNWADAASVEQSFSTPLTAGADFQTFDGVNAFAKPISCLASDAFLEVFFAPSGSGDLSPVTVRQDTDFDGTFDLAQTLPAPVSGVCANGVISCAPGTWTGCQGFAWAAGPSNALTLAPAPLADLAGCYCVNNSCGSGLGVLNEAAILSDLAGGMAGALQAQDARYAVSTVGRTPFQITLSGQSTTSCRADPALPQTAYASDPASLTTDAFSAASSDPLHAKVAAIPSGADVTLTRHACTIERSVTRLDDLASAVQLTPAHQIRTSVVSPSRIDILVGDPSRNSLRNNCDGHVFETTLQIADPSSVTSIILSELHVDDNVQLTIDGVYVYSYPTSWTGPGRPPGSCERATDYVVSPGVDLTSYFADGAPHVLRFRLSVGGRGQLFARISVTGDACSAVQTITDGCGAFAGAPSCRLVEETVDGVQTFRNGGRTGLTPLSAPRTFSSASCSVTLNEPFWLRERDYECEAQGPGAAAPDLTRIKYIYDNSTISSWADQYTAADGSVVTTSGALNPPDPVAVVDCEASCKVRQSYLNSQVGGAGVAAGAQTDPNDIQYAYHACRAGVCPIGPGETLVTDCGCIDAFPEAMVMMQTMRLGGMDMICTTNTPQPF